MWLSCDHTRVIKAYTVCIMWSPIHIYHITTNTTYIMCPVHIYHVAIMWSSCDQWDFKTMQGGGETLMHVQANCFLSLYEGPQTRQTFCRTGITGGVVLCRKWSIMRVYAYEERLPDDASPMSHTYGKTSRGIPSWDVTHKILRYCSYAASLLTHVLYRGI